MVNAVILFKNMSDGSCVDLEVPLNITADEFVGAVNQAYGLNIDMSDPSKALFQMEEPIALLQGDDTLESLGMRMGSIVYYYKR